MAEQVGVGQTYHILFIHPSGDGLLSHSTFWRLSLCCLEHSCADFPVDMSSVLFGTYPGVAFLGHGITVCHLLKDPRSFHIKGKPFFLALYPQCPSFFPPRSLLLAQILDPTLGDLSCRIMITSPPATSLS